jgi:hypothetical protein
MSLVPGLTAWVRRAFLVGLVQSLEAGTLGNIPEEKSRTSEDHHDQESEEKKKEILHKGKLGQDTAMGNKKARLPEQAGFPKMN